MAFNFQARVQLTGPYNVSQVAQQIRAQLSNVQAKVNLQVSSAGLQQIGQINSALYGFSNVSKKAGADLKALNNDIYNFGEQAGLATRRFLAFSVAAGAITGIVVGFKRGVSAAVEFQKELVRFDQISGDTQQSIRGIATEVTRLATTFGVSSKELVQSATVLRQAGLSATEVKTALEALSLAALSPNFGKMSENVEGLIAVTSQFKLKADDLKQAFGSINAVAGDYAVEAKDIIDATIRAGGAFATLGGNLNEFLAIFTTVRATTRESADTIATGLRTIFARLQQSDTVDALKDLQINLRHTGEEAQRLGNINLTGQFVGPYEAIRRLSEGLKDLPSTDPRFAAVVEQIGGIRQISRVLPLLQQDKLRENVLRTATLGTGSLQPGADKAQESLSNRIDKTRESFEKLFRTIANDKGFQAFAKTLLDIASFTAKVTENLTPLISVLGTAAIFKTISSVTQFGSGFVNKFSNDKSKPYYNVRGFATGDVVPGSGNTDSVAANLMPGEFVFRKDAVKNIGIDNLRTLHQRAHVGAGVRHFAQGSDSGAVRRNRFLDKNQLDPEIRKVEELSPLVQRLSSIYPNKPQSTSLLKRIRGGVDSTADYIREHLLSTLAVSVPMGVGVAANSGDLLNGIFSGIGAFASTAAGVGAAGATVTSGKAPDLLGNLVKGIGSGIKGLAKKTFSGAYKASAAGLDPTGSEDFLNELTGKKNTGNYTLAEKHQKEVALLANFFDGVFPKIGVLDWNSVKLDEDPSKSAVVRNMRLFAYEKPAIFQGIISQIRTQLKRGQELGLNTSGKISEVDNVIKDFVQMYNKRTPYEAQLAPEPYLAQLAGEVPVAELTPYTADLLPGKGRRGARDANINAAYNYLDFNRGDTAGAIRYLQESTGLKESTAKRYVRTAAKRLNLPKFAEGGLLGGNIGTAIKRLTSVSTSNLAAVVAGLGLRAGGDNDAYTLEAILKAKRKEGEAVVSSYRPKKYAEGGLHTEVPDLVKSLAGRTGIKLDKFFKKITFNDENFGYGDNALGTFSNKDKAINLNLDKIGDSDKLKKVLAHEIGHSLDYGDGSKSQSNSNESLKQALLSLNPQTSIPAYQKQSRLLRESFAETFRDMMGYGKLEDSKHIQFGNPEKAPIAKQEILKLLETYKEKFPLKKFATGGSVGATDVVPAALTPGEFIFSPEATSRIGVANLHRANKSGDIGHLMSGVTGFHRGGYVGRLNLATGSTKPVETSSVLDEVARSGTLSTFNVNKQQEFVTALASQYQKAAKAEGINLTATEALARAKIELSRVLIESKDQTNIDLRKRQQAYATEINDPNFDINSPYGQGRIKSFEHINKQLDPLLKRGGFNAINGSIVGQGKSVDENLIPSPQRATYNQINSANLASQYYENDVKGKHYTTIAQLIKQTSPTGKGNFTVGSIQRGVEQVLEKKYIDEAKAIGLHINKIDAQTKARAEAIRLLNLATSREYLEKSNQVKQDAALIRSGGFNKLDVKQQEEITKRFQENSKFVDSVNQQTSILTTNKRNYSGVGDYQAPDKPYLDKSLIGRAANIKPVSPLFTSDRDNGFVQKLTKTGTYNTSITNLLASGVSEDKIRQQLESALQSQLKREYEESGKAVSASELLTRSKIGAAKILDVASSKEVQSVNRRVANFERIIGAASYMARPEEFRNRIEAEYNTVKVRQAELQEITAVRTQGTDIIGRGGDINKNSDLARRESRNYRTLLAAQIALPLISGQVNSFAGEAEANLNNRAKYTSLRTGGGALEGGAIGATIGSFTGIPGASVVTGIFGALVGGIVSFVNAGEELRKAKLGETLTTLALNISTATREIEQNGRIGTTTRDSAQNTLREGLSLLKPENINQSSIGRALGAERGLGQALNTLLEDDIRRLVKDNPNLSASDIQGRLEADPNRESIKFKGGSIEANRYQLLSLASTGDAASSAQRTNFTQFIDSIRRSLATESVTRETNRLANAFGLLAGYIDKTSSIFDKVESSIESSLNILGGRGGPERLRLPTDVSSVNPFSSTFGQNFNEQLSPFGAVGVQIGSRANDFQALAQQLPDVINDIFSSSNVTGGGFREALNRRTNDGFSATPIGQQANNIFAELTASGKLSREEIQAGIIEKLGKQFQSIVPSLERIVNLTNTYAAVLNEAAKAQNEAIRFNLQANQAALESERIGGQIRAVQAGRSDGFNFTSRAAFERPFNSNIEQLLAGTPLAGRNNSIADISRAYQGTISDAQDIRSGRPQATDLARRVAGTLGGSAGGLFPGIGGTASAFGATPVNPAAATQSLNKLAEQGNKYRQVLEAYTNVTARAARANEDLAQIRGDRQGRQNLAARFIGGDANQQSEILRGLQVVQGLRDTPGGLNGVGQENASLAISTLQGLGQTRLNIGGQRIAADQYLAQELERAQPGLFGGVNREETDALAELKKINDQAKEAYSALGDANKVFSDKANAWAVDIFNQNSILMGKAAETLNRISVPTPTTPARNPLDTSGIFRGIANSFLPNSLQLTPDGRPGNRPPSIEQPNPFTNDPNLPLLGQNNPLYNLFPFLKPKPKPPSQEEQNYIYREQLRINPPKPGPPQPVAASDLFDRLLGRFRDSAGFAQGGSVFKPKGTDTVPAMLTPGEFIVNAASTKANYSLLKQINDSRQPIYRQGGGPTNPYLNPNNFYNNNGLVGGTSSGQDGGQDLNINDRFPGSYRHLYNQRRTPRFYPEGFEINSPDGITYGLRNYQGRYEPIVAGRLHSNTAIDRSIPRNLENEAEQRRQARLNARVRLARGPYDSPAELLRNSLISVQGGIDYYQRANSRNVQGQQAASYLADSDNPFDRLIYGNQARSYGERITNAAANFRALRRPNETEIGQIRDLNLVDFNPPEPQGQRLDRNRFDRNRQHIRNGFDRNREQPIRGELPNLDRDEIANRNDQLADLRRRGLVPGAPASLVPRFSGDNRPDNPNSVRIRVADLSPEEIVRRNAELARLRNSGVVPGAPPRLVPPAGFNGRNDGRPNNPTLNDDPDFVRRRELAQRLANAPTSRPAGLPTLSPEEVQRRNEQLQNLRNRGLVPGAPSNAVPRFRPQGFANGGFVGTDTIPAMLSPGEFVVNSSATASNISLLKHINTTASPVYRAAGGLIGASPGSASDGGSAFNSGLTQALASFGDSSKTLATALQSFAGTANELAASIARFPTKMEVSVTHNVNVNHNGTQAFATMKEELATLVIGETQSRLQDTFKTAFPDVNISFTGASIK